MIVYYISRTEAVGHSERSIVTEFECLNELKSINSRKIDNVAKMNRFVFECDTVDKDVQTKRALKLVEDGVACRVVDSGNKSIHVIIEVAGIDNLNDVDKYKIIWHYLNAKYFDKQADTACSNPNRLTRTPNAVRMSNGAVQKLLAQSDTQYTLSKEDRAGIQSEWMRQRMLRELSAKSLKISTTHNGMCANWDIITRYLNTPFMKMSGNINSSKWLYAAIKTCQKYKDDQTLQKVLDKARREHWSEAELRHKMC